MSTLFYDHILELDRINEVLKHKFDTIEEQHEIWHLIDKIIHHRVMSKVLEVLPEEHHHELMKNIHAAPHNREILVFISEKSGVDIEGHLRRELIIIEEEILKTIE